MLDFSRVQNYFIACGYTDMRKQIDGLAAVVELQFGKKLDEVSIFLFCGRRVGSDQGTVLGSLYWDGTGYVLLYKRLTEKRFQWLRNEQEWRGRNRQQPGGKRNSACYGRSEELTFLRYPGLG